MVGSFTDDGYWNDVKMNLSADEDILRAIDHLVDATMNRFWHEGVDAKSEYLTQYRGSQENKEEIAKYTSRAEAARKLVRKRIKEYQDFIDAPIPKDQDGFYAQAELSFKLMNSWDLGTDDLIKLCQKPTENEFRGQDGGDLVYVDPSTGTEMTRAMAQDWWKSSGSYKHGFVAGYIAALQAQRDTE